jgi:phage-related protein
MMMNTTDRRDEIVEVEVHREEDINRHPRMNIRQEKIEIIGIEKTEINIGINQMKIRTTTQAQLKLRITIIVSEKIRILVEFRLMREEKRILKNLKPKPKMNMKAITKNIS